MRSYYIESENETLNEHGIEFFRTRYEGEKSCTLAHSHPALEFLYVESGTLNVEIDNEAVSAHSGDLVVLRAQVIHSMGVKYPDSCVYYVLKVRPSLVFEIFRGKTQLNCTLSFLFKHPQAISYLPSEQLGEDIHTIWRRMIRELDDGDENQFVAQRILTAELLLALVRILPRSESSVSGNRDINLRTVGMVYKSIVYINQNYASPITAVDCAKEVNISYSYFAKIFRTMIGKTFKEYLTSVRMSKARNMLHTTETSVTDTALMCGYPNLSYFIAEYKRIYGETPRNARKQLYGI